MSIPITEIAVRRYRAQLRHAQGPGGGWTDPLAITNRARIHTLVKGARLPTIYNSREYVETGGLMSHGPNWLDRWKRTAEIVHKILRGTKPAAISVEQPTKFDLVINLTTAKVLDLAVPPSLLAVADEVME
jgi:putative tryptophan/tyrosine transport system substrate-binding protein